MSIKIGPTGEYSLGEKINENDRGGLFVSMEIINNHIVLNFGTTLDWLATPPEAALDINRKLSNSVYKLMEHKKEKFELVPVLIPIETIGTKESFRLPSGIRLELDHSTGLITTYFLKSVSGFAFNANDAILYCVHLMRLIYRIRPDLIQNSTDS